MKRKKGDAHRALRGMVAAALELAATIEKKKAKRKKLIPVAVRSPRVSAAQ